MAFVSKWNHQDLNPELSESEDHALSACTQSPCLTCDSLSHSHAHFTRRKWFQLIRKPIVLRFQAQSTPRMADTWHIISRILQQPWTVAIITVDLWHLHSQHLGVWLLEKNSKGPRNKTAWFCSGVNTKYKQWKVDRGEPFSTWES